MRRTTVGLVSFGERLPIRAARLASKLNGLQASYQFDDAGIITAAVLGSPDVEGKWYEIQKLQDLVNTRYANRYDLLVGITDCRITETETDEPGKSVERDYFSRSDFNKAAILTVNKSALRYKPPNKSLEQFAAFLIITEVAIMTAKTNLTHFDNNHCIFNECEDRELLSTIIEHGEIGPECLAKIKNANVSDSELRSIRRVLRWCRTNSISNIVAQLLRDPLLTLVAGAGIGWLASIFMSKEQYPTVIGVIALLFIVKLFKFKNPGA